MGRSLRGRMVAAIGYVNDSVYSGQWNARGCPPYVTHNLNRPDDSSLKLIIGGKIIQRLRLRAARGQGGECQRPQSRVGFFINEMTEKFDKPRIMPRVVGGFQATKKRARSTGFVQPICREQQPEDALELTLRRRYSPLSPCTDTRQSVVDEPQHQFIIVDGES